MVMFSNDADILRYEPALFGELHLPSQVLSAGGGGSISGTTFTATEADFLSSQVSGGGVVYLQSSDGSLDGAYEIVSVDSSAELTVSVIRSGPDDEAMAPPAATDVSYRVSTFGPQSSEVGFGLTEYFGLRPGSPASEVSAEEILDTNVLRQAAVFGVISTVYAMLASDSGDTDLWKKSLHYKRLFEKARARCRLSMDVDGDGVADMTRLGCSVRLVRD